MSGHTPGPWQVWDEQGLDIFPVGGGSLIAQVSRGKNGLPPELGEANACLIASAPDLLALLKEVTEDWHWMGDALHEKSEAVIAKAEGR